MQSVYSTATADWAANNLYRVIWLPVFQSYTDNLYTIIWFQRIGQLLTDFMIENRLTCLNTNFQKREGKLWTNTYANNTKAQIDYVFINKKWKNSAMNCETYTSFAGVSSDHRIVTVKIRPKPTKERHMNSDHQTL